MLYCVRSNSVNLKYSILLFFFFIFFFHSVFLLFDIWFLFLSITTTSHFLAIGWVDLRRESWIRLPINLLNWANILRGSAKIHSQANRIQLVLNGNITGSKSKKMHQSNSMIFLFSFSFILSLLFYGIHDEITFIYLKNEFVVCFIFERHHQNHIKRERHGFEMNFKSIIGLPHRMRGYWMQYAIGLCACATAFMGKFNLSLYEWTQCTHFMAMHQQKMIFFEYSKCNVRQSQVWKHKSVCFM